MPFLWKSFFHFLFIFFIKTLTLLMALAALTFLITNTTSYNTHVTILALFTMGMLQLCRKGTSTLYAIIKK